MPNDHKDQTENAQQTPREWCTSCRLAALDEGLDKVHLCAGQGQHGAALCGCDRPGCHVPRGMADLRFPPEQKTGE